MVNWDQRFMELACYISQWSKDRHTKVGCVIVGVENEILSIGYNNFPRGINDDVAERHERPEKYSWIEHAERNAIYNAARIGISLKGSKMYLPWFPCMDCARAIVQSGVSELIAIEPDFEHTRWGTDFKQALLLFTEAGVKLTWYLEKLPKLSNLSDFEEIANDDNQQYESGKTYLLDK
jgi:dCMP deaminase